MLPEAVPAECRTGRHATPEAVPTCTPPYHPLTLRSCSVPLCWNWASLLCWRCFADCWRASWHHAEWLKLTPNEWCGVCGPHGRPLPRRWGCCRHAERQVRCRRAVVGATQGRLRAQVQSRERQSIPSQIYMPYSDLVETMQHTRPVDPNLQCTLWEVYSVPRLGPAVRSLGGSCRRSYDLKNFWDLKQEGFQRTLLTDVSILQPRALVLSPPCTWVSMLMHSNWNRVGNLKRVLNLF